MTSLGLAWIVICAPPSDAERIFLLSNGGLVLSRAHAAVSDSVQKYLQCTDEERAELALLRDVLKEAGHGDRRRIPEIRSVGIKDGTFRLIENRFDEDLDSILGATRLKRLSELQLRALGPWAPFHLTCLIEHLNVSSSQSQQARDLLARFTAESQQLQISLRDRPGELAKARVKVIETIGKERDSILTPGQRERLDVLLGAQGDLVSLLLRESVPQRNRGSIRSGFSDWASPSHLLFEDDLLGYLKVTDEQRKRLEEIVDAERKSCREEMAGSPQLPARIADFQKRTKDIQRQIAEVFDREQMSTLSRAYLQVRGLNEVYSGSETARVLKITAEQRKAFNEFQPKTDEWVEEKLAFMASNLSPQQRERFEELKGAPLPQPLIMKLKRLIARSQERDEFGIPTFGIGRPKRT